MNIKIAMIACACLSSMGQAHARNFPAQAQQCKILDTSLPHALVVHLEARGAIGLSSALVIRDENNRIIVRGALPKAFQGMCSFGIGGEIEKIWIMKPDEIAAMAKEGRK